MNTIYATYKLFSIKFLHLKSFISKEKLFKIFCFLCTVLPLFVFGFLLLSIFADGISKISWSFLTSLPSRDPLQAGIFSSLVGSLLLFILTLIFAVPLGVLAGIYLHEYGGDSFISKLVKICILNLAGVPSVIMGIFGLYVFVKALYFGASLLSGALTLSLLLMPILVSSTVESLKLVPISIREAGFALGASKRVVITKIIFPLALSNILTGVILSMARSVGETAPLIVLGAATYIAYTPSSIFSEFSALPLQIFHWIERPDEEFAKAAAGAILVLLFILLMFNAAANLIRSRSANWKVDL